MVSIKSVEHLAHRLDQVAGFMAYDNAKEIASSGLLNSRKRAAVLNALLSLPGLPAYLYRSRIVKPYGRKGLVVVGAGAHAIAVEDGPSSIRKFYPETRAMNPDEKEVFIDRMAAKQEITMQHLSPFALEQTFHTEEDPLRRGRSIVVAHQKRALGEAINVINDRAVISSNPSWMNFIASSSEMLEMEGAVPDMFGNRNLVMHDEEVSLVDTVAIEKHDPLDHAAFQRSSSLLLAMMSDFAEKSQ